MCGWFGKLRGRRLLLVLVVEGSGRQDGKDENEFFHPSILIGVHIKKLLTVSKLVL